MYDLMGPGLAIGPWTGLWEQAWQSPTTGFALLACLPTLLLTGFFLMTRDANRSTPESLVPLAEAAQAASEGRARGRRHDEGRRRGRGQAAA